MQCSCGGALMLVSYVYCSICVPVVPPIPVVPVVHSPVLWCLPPVCVCPHDEHVQPYLFIG